MSKLVALFAVGATAAGIALGYAAWRGSAGGSGATACLPHNGACGTTAAVNVGDDMELSVTVPTNSDPVSVHAVIDGVAGTEHAWDTLVTGWTYTIDFGAAPSNALGNHSLYGVVTFADGSTLTTGTCTLSISDTSCQTGQVTCRKVGALGWCCPDGDSCVDSGGSCPTGTQKDSANPGCCVPSSSGIRYPAAYAGPSPIYVDVRVCQPICDDIICSGCCSQPVVDGLSTSVAIQVLDQNGAPLTGVTMLWQWNGSSNGLYLDAQSYKTDGRGFFYPTISLPSSDVPTECSGGNYNITSAEIIFGMQGAPQGSAVYQVEVAVVGAWSTPMGSYGSCGSC